MDINQYCLTLQQWHWIIQSGNHGIDEDSASGVIVCSLASYWIANKSFRSDKVSLLESRAPSEALENEKTGYTALRNAQLIHNTHSLQPRLSISDSVSQLFAPKLWANLEWFQDIVHMPFWPHAQLQLEMVRVWDLYQIASFLAVPLSSCIQCTVCKNGWNTCTFSDQKFDVMRRK